MAVIPARSGSKGVPNKNIRDLGGEPLLSWAIAAAKNSATISRVIVSTDSEDYAGIALKAGAEVPFLRPHYLSEDASTDFEFVDHALSWFADNEADSEFPSYLVHLRPTTPFRDPRIIDRAVNMFIGLEGEGYTALRSVHHMPESAYKSFEISKGNRLATCFEKKFNVEGSNAGRQQFPITYCANGYVDVLSVKALLEDNVIHGDSVYAFETDIAYEVDAQSDFDWLEYVLMKNPCLKDLAFGL